MSAQEFSSPGEHMASMSGSPVGVSSNGVLYSGQLANSVGFPPMHYGSVNNAFNNFRESQGYTGGSARSFSDEAHDFNKYYMSYNDILFNSAKAYDMYMSNSAIQRQVEDLKKAGLNPILASRLGGATYKGVNAPYMSISPSSALQAYASYDSSIYASDTSRATALEVAKINTSSNELISAYDRLNKLVMQDKQINADREMAKLNGMINEHLENLKHLNNKDLQRLGFENEQEVARIQHEYNKETQKLQNQYEKELEKYRQEKEDKRQDLREKNENFRNNERIKVEYFKAWTQFAGASVQAITGAMSKLLPVAFGMPTG